MKFKQLIAFIGLLPFVAVMPSCTSSLDEPEESIDIPVNFTANIESSRSIITAGQFASEGSAFRVWATMHSVENGADVSRVFDGSEVTSDGNGSWAYEGVRYWYPLQTYNFRALYPAGVENVEFSNGNGENASLKVKDFDVRSGIDLLAASVRREIPSVWVSDVALQLEFAHLLTRVSFRGRSDESLLGRGRRVIVTSAALYGMAATGTWTGSDRVGSWEPGEPVGTLEEPLYKVEFPDGLELSTQGTDIFTGDDVILAIPQRLPLEARIVIECHYNVADAQTFTFEAPFSEESFIAEWGPGASLRYPFTVASGVFFSSPEVVDWTEISVDSPDYKIE